MNDIVLILLFWAMVLGPCLVALHTGAHLDNEETAVLPDDSLRLPGRIA